LFIDRIPANHNFDPLITTCQEIDTIVQYLPAHTYVSIPARVLTNNDGPAAPE
jgi:hypothetical protein